jgi:hypothetical protein
VRTFNDNAGRTWTIAINVAAIKRVRGLLNVNLYKLVDDGFKPLGALVGEGDGAESQFLFTDWW